ncbi:MAG TPA: discoidin domain-containing protein, partial [Chryseosolibacter sp.]|nr:discoidin domain-containing protein [Chryseosolibacter sp.]
TPGQTLCLGAGFYKQIRLIRISGEPGNRVTIKNCGGMVVIGDTVNYGRWYALDIVNSTYIRVTGSGDPAIKYGINLAKSGDTGLKVGSTDVELDHLEIGNTNFAGIMAKVDYGGNPPPNAPEMNNINIHDNYIHDTRGEGMYIGETKTPGMHFRHLEVWNNVVTRTGLDFFQVANVVEDVQVHHNVFYQAGTRNVLYQNKGLQIGDNSVGRFYNNIVIGAPSNSMIVLGSGDIEITSNYLAGAGDPGFFIDNRSVTVPGTPINIHKNYLMDVNELQPFFKIFNEINPIDISQNILDGNNEVLFLGTGVGPNLTESSNVKQVIERIQFTDIATDNFSLIPGSPYQGLGLMEDVSGRTNRPFIARLQDQELDVETSIDIPVSAGDPDGDAIILEAFNLPPFVTFKDNGNGNGMFTLSPHGSDVGIFYKVRVRATDSHGAMNTQYFSITVLDPFALIATASSSLGTFLPENTLDGNMATRWEPAAGTGHWIKYNLIEDKLVTDVKIAFFEGTSAAYPFDIEVSEDDSTWMPVFSGSSSGTSTALETFAFNQVRARYLRILDKSDSANSYNEVVINCTTAPIAHQYSATDDVYVDGKRVINNNVLNVKDQIRKSYIRFSVTGLDVNQSPVIAARLKLTAMTSASGSLKVYLGDQKAWTQADARRTNLPSAVQILDTLTTAFIAGGVYELNLSPAISDNGIYNLILVFESGGRAGLSFSSAEGAFPPEILIETLRGAIVLSQAAVSLAVNSAELFTTSDPKEVSLEEMRVYPNPVKHEMVTVDLGLEPSSYVSLEICDHVGKSLMQKRWIPESQFIGLDLNALNIDSGLYLIKVKQDGLPLKILRLMKE